MSESSSSSSSSSSGARSFSSSQAPSRKRPFTETQEERRARLNAQKRPRYNFPRAEDIIVARETSEEEDDDDKDADDEETHSDAESHVSGTSQAESSISASPHASDDAGSESSERRGTKRMRTVAEALVRKKKRKTKRQLDLERKQNQDKLVAHFVSQGFSKIQAQQMSSVKQSDECLRRLKVEQHKWGATEDIPWVRCVPASTEEGQRREDRQTVDFIVQEVSHSWAMQVKMLCKDSMNLMLSFFVCLCYMMCWSICLKPSNYTAEHVIQLGIMHAVQ